MSRMKILLLFFLAIHREGFSQTGFFIDDHRESFEQFFQEMNKQMDQLFKDMSKQRDKRSLFDFPSFFGRDSFSTHSCSWIDKGLKRILPLDMAPVENSPLKVDVKDSQILISGQVKKEEKNSKSNSIHISSLYLSCPIPKDLDSTSIKVELVKGKYQIEMAKKNKKKQEKKPLPPDEGDISI